MRLNQQNKLRRNVKMSCKNLVKITPVFRKFSIMGKKLMQIQDIHGFQD